MATVNGRQGKSVGNFPMRGSTAKELRVPRSGLERAQVAGSTGPTCWAVPDWWVGGYVKSLGRKRGAERGGDTGPGRVQVPGDLASDAVRVGGTLTRPLGLGQRLVGDHQRLEGAEEVTDRGGPRIRGARSWASHRLSPTHRRLLRKAPAGNTGRRPGFRGTICAGYWLPSTTRRPRTAGLNPQPGPFALCVADRDPGRDQFPHHAAADGPAGPGDQDTFHHTTTSSSPAMTGPAGLPDEVPGPRACPARRG